MSEPTEIDLLSTLEKTSLDDLPLIDFPEFPNKKGFVAIYSLIPLSNIKSVLEMFPAYPFLRLMVEEIIKVWKLEWSVPFPKIYVAKIKNAKEYVEGCEEAVMAWTVVPKNRYITNKKFAELKRKQKQTETEMQKKGEEIINE